MKLDNDVRTLFENELTLIREKISLRRIMLKVVYGRLVLDFQALLMEF